MTKATTQELNDKIHELEESLVSHQNIINELKDNLKVMEKVETEGTVGWEPSLGNVFFTGKGTVWDRPLPEHSTHGNSHTDTKAAEKHAKFQQLQNWIYQLALELNDGWEPDWNNADTLKFFISFSHYTGNLSYYYWSQMEFPGVSYFKDEETVKKAIKIINSWNLDYDFSA